MSKRLTMLLYVVCVLLVAADLLYHKHTHFASEELFGFYAFYGLVTSIAFVVVGRAVAAILGRPEDYYGDE